MFDQNSNDDFIPIIIDKTIAIKSGLSIGDTTNLDYKINELTNDENVAELNDPNMTSFGYDKTEITNEYVPESGQNYYFTKGAYIDDAAGMFDAITPAKVAGSDISAKKSKESTNALEMEKNVLAGKVQVSTKNQTDKFKVVGIQSSYGVAQAWISNNNAKHLMRYDDSEEFLYKQLFKWQWSNVLKNNSLDAFGGKTIDEMPDKLNDLEVKASSEDKYAKLSTLFYNMYPIFNYKNSLDKTTYDISTSMNTMQQFSDYSAIGLNGGVDTASQKFMEGFG